MLAVVQQGEQRAHIRVEKKKKEKKDSAWKSHPSLYPSTHPSFKKVTGSWI